MLCPRCNTFNRENARFCKGCGMHFTAEQLAEAQAAGVAQANDGASANAVASANTTPAAQAQTPPAVPTPELVAEEDMALAPTQIISPKEMAALQARRWQSELEQSQQHHAVDAGQQEHPPSDAVEAPANAQVNGVAAHMPEAKVEQEPQSAARSEEKNDTANKAATTTDTKPPSAEDEAQSSTSSAAAEPDPALMETVYTPQPQQELPPPDQQNPALQETVYAAAPQEQQNAQDPAQMETVYGDIPTPAPEDKAVSAQPAKEGVFPMLAVGTTLVERYEVTQVLSEDEQEHVYQVVDHQGYQRCWNCASEQNAEGDEYCIDCGAALLNMTYTMHEYPATQSKNQDAHVLAGTIVNTFIQQGQTYMIEQPQATQIYFPNGVHLLAACDSDAGDLRRADPNEDSTLLLQLQRVHESNSAPIGVFIVADGMGGHDNGQGASRMAINVIAERLVNELLMKPLAAEKAGQPRETLAEDDLVAIFKGSIEEANAAICHVNQKQKTDMGSTLTGFMVANDHAYIVNVGDSRTYMLRDGTLYQLTNDHSLVGQLLAGGLIEPDDVYTHPQRSQIFRSLGDKLNTQVDDFKQQLHPGDILLSCCDGLWEMIRNPQITDILSNAPDPQTACTQLIEAANANGGEDNISAVVVFVR